MDSINLEKIEKHRAEWEEGRDSSNDTRTSYQKTGELPLLLGHKSVHAAIGSYGSFKYPRLFKTTVTSKQEPSSPHSL